MGRKKKGIEPETSKSPTPDFDSAKGYYWMKQIYELERQGSPVASWPRKPRKTKAEREFFGQVDKRLSRRSYTMGVSIEGGKLVREETQE